MEEVKYSHNEKENLQNYFVLREFLKINLFGGFPTQSYAKGLLGFDPVE